MKHLHIIGLLALVALATGCTTRVGPRTGITREQAISELNASLGKAQPVTFDATGIHHSHQQVTDIKYVGNTTYYYGRRWQVVHPYKDITEVGVKRSAMGLLTFFVMDPTIGSAVYIKCDGCVDNGTEKFMPSFGLYSFFPFYFFKPAALQVRKPAETLEALRLNQFDPSPATTTETK